MLVTCLACCHCDSHQVRQWEDDEHMMTSFMPSLHLSGSSQCGKLHPVTFIDLSSGDLNLQHNLRPSSSATRPHLQPMFGINGHEPLRGGKEADDIRALKASGVPVI